MPSIPLGVSVVEATALNLLQTILVRSRSIGPFVANVTLDEHHEDRVAITETPVEQGADVTDHAYKRPARLAVRVGFSNSSLQALGNPIYDQQIYAGFLAMQASLEPIQVVTGKRVYNNMLVEDISLTTNESTENSLVMTVELREIIVVTTQTVTVPPASSLASPQANGATNPVGQKALAPAPNFNAAA